MATYVTINYLDPPRSIKVTKDRDKDQDLGKDGKVNGNGKVFMSQRILKGKPALRRIQLERLRRKSADCLIRDRTDLSEIDSCLIEPLPTSTISNHSSSSTFTKTFRKPTTSQSTSLETVEEDMTSIGVSIKSKTSNPNHSINLSELSSDTVDGSTNDQNFGYTASSSLLSTDKNINSSSFTSSSEIIHSNNLKHRDIFMAKQSYNVTPRSTPRNVLSRGNSSLTQITAMTSQEQTLANSFSFIQDSNVANIKQAKLVKIIHPVRPWKFRIDQEDPAEVEKQEMKERSGKLPGTIRVRKTLERTVSAPGMRQIGFDQIFPRTKEDITKPVVLRSIKYYPHEEGALGVDSRVINEEKQVKFSTSSAKEMVTVRPKQMYPIEKYPLRTRNTDNTFRKSESVSNDINKNSRYSWDVNIELEMLEECSSRMSGKSLGSFCRPKGVKNNSLIRNASNVSEERVNFCNKCPHCWVLEKQGKVSFSSG